MKLRDRIENKLCERCGNCPFYYYERGLEDCDEGCNLKGWSWDEGVCLYMFLPRWVAKIRRKWEEHKEARWYNKREKKLKAIYENCPYKSDGCHYYKCTQHTEDL